ncbi:MAG: PEP-CTERM-box response regulator transcription factor [Deltaproteobacteria bacterium]|nr:PEP-CTERM-box response regulator transcription factor [Deltaproteobacteria bacterium]
MKKPELLVIDDEESIRSQMKWALIEDYDVFVAENAATAMKIMDRQKPPLVTLDLGLPPDPEGIEEGLKLLERILINHPASKVIVVSGNPDSDAPLQAISKGAHDFFTKPINIDELKGILKRACYVYSLESKYQSLQRKFHYQSFKEMIGSSSKMQEVFSTVKKIATTDVPVLILGESGTGKELVANAVHDQSLRGGKAFVPINCGAIPENLMESELFGHEKGSFTGAHTQRKGKIELAHEGTLFLDEIGDLPLPLQVKLLRFLQDNKLERIGGRETINLDVRVVAATNKRIEDLVREGHFREDLYYRLAVVTIDLPPIRERGEDKLLLAKSFLQKYGANRGNPKSLTPEAIESIDKYEWPGNVRELENKIQRALAFADGNHIIPADLALGSAEGESKSLNLKKAREALDIKYINTAIMKNKGNISRAAEDLGLTRPTLHALMNKYCIKK